MGTAKVLGALLLVAVTAGCASSRDATVQQVADDFRAAVRSGDADAACRALSDPVRYSLELDSGTTCAVELRDVRLPAEGTARKVSVSGTAAQVRYGDDVVFLTDDTDGWRVLAAGCSSRASGPYDCQVGG